MFELSLVQFRNSRRFNTFWVFLLDSKINTMKTILKALLISTLFSCNEEIIDPETGEKEENIQDVLKYNINIEYDEDCQGGETIPICIYGMVYYPPYLSVESDSLIESIGVTEVYGDKTMGRTVKQGEDFNLFVYKLENIEEYSEGEITIRMNYKDSSYIWSKSIEILFF